MTGGNPGQLLRLPPEAVKKLPGGGTGPPTRLATPCESLETERPRAVLSRNFEFLHSFPLPRGNFHKIMVSLSGEQPELTRTLTQRHSLLAR